MKTKKQTGNDSTQSLFERFERELSDPKFRRGFIEAQQAEIFFWQDKYMREKKRLDLCMWTSSHFSNRRELDKELKALDDVGRCR